jgi:hypothetical protein
MVGLLNAPRGTKLYQRLVNEGRLLKGFSGNNTDFSINFIPKMSYQMLFSGYRKVLHTIYSPKYYYERILTLLRNLESSQKKKFRLRLCHLEAFLKSIWFLGIRGKGRIYYWKLILWSLFRCPQFFPLAITFAIYGFHFRKIIRNY